MKILVLSSTPWSDDNSFGNSYSNIFEGIEGLEFANIACRPGMPTSYVVKRYFQITEKALLKNLKNKKLPTGKELPIDTENNEAVFSENIKAREFGRKRRWKILFWARDFLWKIGRWKSQALIDFIDDYNPDLIFAPIYFSSHMNDILQFIKKHTGVPMIGYISDDCYTLRQFSLSPLYWIDRLCKRRKVKKSIEQCELLYVISDIQKTEYEKIFTPPCKILTKCADFSGEAPEYEPTDDTVKLIYAGNISHGRGESLSYICRAVERLNNEGFKVKFDIYSGSPLSKKTEEAFSLAGSEFHGRVPYSEIKRVESAADILVHVEGLSLKERLAVHQSFSTKLVDFFEMGKCIFAVGSYDEAFAKHLIDNDAALVSDNEAGVYEKLKALVESREKRDEYGKKAYACGKKHHDKSVIQKMLKEDIFNTANKK